MIQMKNVTYFCNGWADVYYIRYIRTHKLPKPIWTQRKKKLRKLETAPYPELEEEDTWIGFSPYKKHTHIEHFIIFLVEDVIMSVHEAAKVTQC